MVVFFSISSTLIRADVAVQGPLVYRITLIPAIQQEIATPTALIEDMVAIYDLAKF